MYKKILITGAEGMLGSTICRVLEPFYHLTCVDYADFDIRANVAVARFFAPQQFDAIVHCAAYTDVDRAEDEAQKAILINAEGAKNLVENLRGKDSFLIYISTDYVFDGQKSAPYLEEDLPNPIGVYGLSKLKGEEAVAALKKHIIIRTSWLFGPQGKNFIDTIARLSKEKDELEVVGDQRGSPTYTLDLSKAIKSFLDLYFEKGLKSGIYNVTNSGNCSWFELAKYILNLLNSSAKIKPISSEVLNRKAKRPRNSVLSNEKFHALTGYYLPPWQEAVKHYI